MTRSADDLPPALVLDPFLTVVEQPAYDMGQRATELLLARLAGDEFERALDRPAFREAAGSIPSPMSDLSNVRDVYERLGEIQLVDCREPYEWEAGRVAGAIHIPVNSIMAGAGGDLDKDKPIAVIPLKIKESVIGVISINKLLVQKTAFTSMDYELFTLLAGHSATAIFSSKLYSESERKLSTIQGFIDLLTK